MRSVASIGMSVAVLVVFGCNEQRARHAAALKTATASPVQADRPSGADFHGLDLSKSRRTSDASDLPDLLEERPQGSRSFKIREDVACVYSGLDGAVYHIAEKNRFYIQQDPVGASTMTYFGPFEGDPAKILRLGAQENAEQES